MFARADADDIGDFRNEYLPVTDLASVRRLRDRGDRRFELGVGHDDLDLQLGQEVDDVFGAPIELGVTALAAEALGFKNSHPLKADGMERLLHFVELEGLDDRLDLLHRGVPVRRRCGVGSLPLMHDGEGGV